MIPTDACIVHPGGVRGPGPTSGEELGAHLAGRVKNLLGVSRVLADRVTVPEEVGTSEGVVVAGMVIDFADDVVDRKDVGETDGYGAGRVVICAVVLQQVQAERIELHSLRGQGRLGIGKALARTRTGHRGGRIGGKCVAHAIRLPLEGAEIEKLVLDDGPADCASPLLELHRLLGRRRDYEIGGVPGAVAAVGEGRAVNRVPARL